MRLNKLSISEITAFLSCFICNSNEINFEDPEISADQIYGKVVLKSVVLTTISKVINTTYGFYFIIFVPFVVIVTLEIIDTVNERKRLKRS